MLIYSSLSTTVQFQFNLMQNSSLEAYTNTSLCTDSYFAVSEIHRVALAIKIPHSDPSLDRSIKISRPTGKVFEPYRMIYEELKGPKKQLTSERLCKERHFKSTTLLFGGRGERSG